MPLSLYFKNKALDVLRNQTFTGIATTYASLHTADPGETGASEVTGGTPAYARKSTTWNASSGGTIDNSNVPVFDVPAGTTVKYVGLWDAVTAGNFLGSDRIADEVYAAQGTFTLTDMNIHLNNHNP